MHGEVVTETLDHDGGRAVSVYVPPTSPEAIVFAGDGELVAPWGADLEGADLPPTMIVGAHHTSSADEMERIKEYSPGFDPERFAAHERFFVDDVRAWVHVRFGVDLPRERTAVFGVSAGGELSLAIGLRHPDVYGSIWCASPGGGYHPPSPVPATVPRTYLYAGADEPWFMENAARWATALGEAGIEVVLVERAGNHGDPFWREELPGLAAWSFGG